MEEKQVELVPIEEKKAKFNDEMDEILLKLLNFFNKDIDATIQYIILGEIPVDHITPGKRIDLHPTREYLLRMSRIMNELKGLKDKMDESGDMLDNFYDDI